MFHASGEQIIIGHRNFAEMEQKINLQGPSDVELIVDFKNFFTGVQGVFYSADGGGDVHLVVETFSFYHQLSRLPIFAKAIFWAGNTPPL